MIHRPAPIAGGGIHNGAGMYLGGVVKFTQNITQFGMTCSTNGTQYITVWNKQGTMLGQVTWVPAGDAPSSASTPRACPSACSPSATTTPCGPDVADIGGATNISDTWMWAVGGCTSDAECNDGNGCTTDTCDILTGACNHANNGNVCNDGDACTQDDSCVNGVCVGSNPVTCVAFDSCHDVGVCNPGTGMCTNPPGGRRRHLVRRRQQDAPSRTVASAASARADRRSARRRTAATRPACATRRRACARASR
ncbi:MAG: hypothetical protein U0359_04195 [Byssovorax sp.]